MRVSQVVSSLVITVFLLVGLWLIGMTRAASAFFADSREEQSSVMNARSSITYTLFLPVISKESVSTIFGVQTYSPLPAIPLAQGAHVSHVRVPIEWSTIEPANVSPDVYNFTPYDTMILNLTQVGIHPIITIVGNPSWAATYKQGPIDKVDPSRFTNFISALVGHYSGASGMPEVVDWEFYNEPDNGSILYAQNGGFGYWGNNGAGYAQMLCSVYPAVKAANPRARVVFGGMAYDNWTPGPFIRNFLDDVLNAGGSNCFDVMNFHYYPPFAANWAPYGPGISGKANYLRSKVPSKPIVATEASWVSDGSSTPEIQSRYVVQLFTQSKASGLDYMIWWTWTDMNPCCGAVGLITQDTFTPKPSYYTFQTAATKIGVNAFQRALSPTELGNTAMEGYLLGASQKPLYVLWSNDGVTRTVPINLPRAQVTDMYGTILGSFDAGVDGNVPASVGANPIYVEAAP